MAGDDPVKIDAYLKMPLWDYWVILDHKIATFEKEQKQSQIKKK